MIAGLAMQRTGRVTIFVLAAALLAAAAGWPRRETANESTVRDGKENARAIVATAKEETSCGAGARHSRALMYLLR